MISKEALSEELSSYGQITEVTASSKKPLSIFKSILAAHQWIKNRNPVISILVLDRYEEFYASFLIDGISKLFSNYLSAAADKKILSENEIQEAVSSCIELDEKLNSHIKLISAELDHIIKWLDIILVEPKDSNGPRTLYDFLIDDIEKLNNPEKKASPKKKISFFSMDEENNLDLDTLLSDKIKNTEKFMEANMLLGEMMEPIARLHNNLKIAIQLSQTLCCLKDLYVKVKPNDISLLPCAQQYLQLTKKTAFVKDKYTEGLVPITQYLNAIKLARFITGIQEQMEEFLTLDELSKIKERFDALTATFKKSVGNWKSANLTTKIKNEINNLNSIISATHENHKKNPTSNQLELTYLIFFKEELYSYLQKIKRAQQSFEKLTKLASTLEQQTKNLKKVLEPVQTILNSIKSDIVAVTDYWSKRKIIAEMIIQRRLEANELNKEFFGIFNNLINLVAKNNIDHTIFPATVDLLLNNILNAKKTFYLLKLETDKFDAYEDSIDDNLQELAKKLAEETFKKFAAIINNRLESYRNEKEEKFGENSALLTEHLRALLALASRIFNPKEVAQQEYEELNENLSADRETPLKLTSYSDKTLLANLSCLNKLTVAHQEHAKILATYKTKVDHEIQNKFDENTMLLWSRNVANILEQKQFDTQLKIIENDCQEKLLCLEKLLKTCIELTVNLNKLIKDIELIIEDKLLKPLERDLINFYKIHVENSLVIVEHRLSKLEELASHPKQFLASLKKQASEANVQEIPSLTLT